MGGAAGCSTRPAGGHTAAHMCGRHHPRQLRVLSGAAAAASTSCHTRSTAVQRPPTEKVHEASFGLVRRRTRAKTNDEKRAYRGSHRRSTKVAIMDEVELIMRVVAERHKRDPESLAQGLVLKDWGRDWCCGSDMRQNGNIPHQSCDAVVRRHTKPPVLPLH